jgi:hypothetical protein
MKKTKFLPITLIALAALLMSSVAYASPSAALQDYRASLSGAQEVPPRSTPATGTAFFQLSDDGMSIAYTLTVSNISNVFAAHIHCGAKGVNGPVGVTLYMGTPGGGAFEGTLAKGTITAPDPGNNCGWTDLAAVVAAMNSGNTYVNVHTNDGVAPTNTGPGDFPGGEIRGQITKVLPAKTK